MLASQPPLQDAEAFGDLFSRTQIIVFRFIYGLHGGPLEEVEDLACETYMRAWKARTRFHGNEKDALSWLFTIARHLVIDEHRRAKRHSEGNTATIDDQNLDAMFEDLQATPEEQTAKREQFEHLWLKLRDLSDDKREMLVLRYILGWQVKQIAEYLKMEENTVTVNIRRTLEKIRQAWTLE